MEIRLYSKDSIRIKSDSDGRNFIDVAGTECDVATAVTMYPGFHDIEIREKGGVLQMYIFKDPESKSEFDYGYFADAPIIFSHQKRA